MKTSKLFAYLTALILLISVSSCTTYYSSRPAYGRHYGYRRPVAPAPRPYGGHYGYYGRPGW